jgi:predicted DNA-binding transcriptional regulator AlpA
MKQPNQLTARQVELRADDILTPEQLAERLQVKKSWIFEQTRNRAKTRNDRPLPCIRLGKYLRFNWRDVSEWLTQNSSG